MFDAHPEYYAQNYENGNNARAGYASIAAPHGEEPGVVISGGPHLKFVLTIDQAYNLADRIADAIETHPHRVATQQEK
jgi:hypothetical protein